MVVRRILFLCFITFSFALALLGLVPPSIFLDEERQSINPAKRVIIFPPLLSGYATLDEGVAHVIGASAFMPEILAKAPLGRAYPALASIKPVSTWPKGTTFPTDPEQVLLMKPDVVFVFRRTGDVLKQSGLPVLDVDSLNSTTGAVHAWYQMASTAIRHDRANWIQKYCDDASQETYRTISAITDRPSPRALLLWRNDPRVLNLGLSGFPPAGDIEREGAINLAASYKLASIDVEQLLALNPDMIFLYGISQIDQEPRTFLDDPLFQSLNAVRNRRIYKLPIIGSRSEGLVPDHALFLRWMAELLYPDHMPKQLRDMIKSTYRTIYGYELSDREIDDAIYAKENGLSAGYKRFSLNDIGQ